MFTPAILHSRRITRAAPVQAALAVLTTQMDALSPPARNDPRHETDAVGRHLAGGPLGPRKAGKAIAGRSHRAFVALRRGAGDRALARPPEHGPRQAR